MPGSTHRSSRRLGWRALVSLSALLGLGAGCMPVPPMVPLLPVLPHPEAQRDALGESPVEHLARWDGESFVPVAPGTLPPSHLHVLVHGWAPGWGRQMQGDSELRAWDATNSSGVHFAGWMAELAPAILEADPHAIVLAYSWIDDAATSRFIFAQRAALGRTDRAGRRLSAALVAAREPGFEAGSGRVHLIGHSYGARVAAVAALNLPKAPRQLTIFDSPETSLTYLTGGQTRLEDLLRKLPIGHEPGQVFVDNYVSMVGSRYGQGRGVRGVVDVSLSPPYGALAYGPRHNYPAQFYARTVAERFGLGWSPLIATPPAAGCFEQPYGELALHRGCAGL